MTEHEYAPDPFLNELFQTDTAKQRKRGEEEDRKHAQLVLAARDLLARENGKRFLYWLINQTGVFSACFTGNSTTFYLEGKRSVGLEIYRLLMESNPDAFQELINFQRNEEVNHQGEERAR